MPFEIVVDDVARILRARYSGEVRLAERVALARRVLEEAERTGIFHWLLDFRGAQASAADPADAVRMADEFTPHFPDDTRMAYLLNYDHQLDDSVEHVVRSRGVQVERFHSLEQAIAWLGSEPAAQPLAAQETALHRALRLATKAIGEAPLPPGQFAAVGELVHELLASGIGEEKSVRMAGRIVAAMRQPRG